MKYWLQTKNKAVGWVDSLGSADVESCIDHGKWFVEEGHYKAENVRVIKRKDTKVWAPPRGKKK